MDSISQITCRADEMSRVWQFLGCCTVDSQTDDDRAKKQLVAWDASSPLIACYRNERMRLYYSVDLQSVGLFRAATTLGFGANARRRAATLRWRQRETAPPQHYTTRALSLSFSYYACQLLCLTLLVVRPFLGQKVVAWHWPAAAPCTAPLIHWRKKEASKCFVLQASLTSPLSSSGGSRNSSFSSASDASLSVRQKTKAALLWFAIRASLSV